MTLRIILDSLPPVAYAANSSTKGTGNYWRKREAREQALNDVGVALNQSGWDHKTLETAKVTVTFYLPTRGKRDHGGLVERMKPIWDALTVPSYLKSGEISKDGYGVLRDDDLACIGWPTYSHEYRPRNPGTLIEVE